MYTPPQIAKQLHVNTDKVYTWIRSGELVAFNVATRPDSRRARYRVSEESLQAFLRARTPNRLRVVRRRPRSLSLDELRAKLKQSIDSAYARARRNR